MQRPVYCKRLRTASVSPASSRPSRFAASHICSPAEIPPPTNVSNLLGSTALCGLRRAIQKRRPSSVTAKPLIWTAWLYRPSGRKAERSRAKRICLLSPDQTSKRSLRHPPKRPASCQRRASCSNCRPISLQLSATRCRPSESSCRGLGQSRIRCFRQTSFTKPNDNPFNRSGSQSSAW